MDLQKMTRNIILLPFILMIFGFRPSFSAIFLLIVMAGCLSLLTDRFSVAYQSVAQARMLRLAHSRRKLIAGLVLITLPVVLTLTIAPSISHEGELPNVAHLKAFSAETKYMSREGYLKYVARRYHGMEISKSEARKILRRQRKGASSYSTHSHSVHTQYAADPIRSKYGAEAERYRLKTYHGKKISRANQEWKKAATPVRSRFSNRGNRVLESSHPNTPSSGVQFSRKARVNSAVQNKQNSRSVYCSECGKYHTGNHYHGTWCRSCNQYHATDLHSRVHNGCTQCTASSVHSSQTCIHCTPKTKKRVVTKKLRSTSSHLIRPVQTHKIVERSSYKSFRYRKNRVAIFPFQNRNVEKVPAGRVEDEIARQLSRKGYEVVTLPMDVYGDSLGNSKESYREMAERLGVEYIVSGDVLKYSDYKKMRLAGLVLGGILTGVHGYGDVAIDSHVYSLSANRLMAKQARERTRKQVLGVLGGTGDLIGLSLERAVNKLYAFM